MRQYEIPQDYKHIVRYGELNNWSKEFVSGQQYRAYMINAPFDTVEVTPEGAIIRFEYLPKEIRKMFGESK